MSEHKESITLGDILSDKTGQNKQLSSDLLFANKCLNILTKFKSFVDLVFTDYKNHFNTNDIQKYEKFKEEIEEVLNHNQRPVDTREIVIQKKNVVADQPSAVSSKVVQQIIDPKMSIVFLKINDLASFDPNMKLIINQPKQQQLKTSVSKTNVNPDVKPVINERQKTRICFYCKKGFPNAAVLMAHMKEDHTKNFPKPIQLSSSVRQSAKPKLKFDCTVSVCNKSFSSREYLGLHIKSVHRSQVSSFLADNPILKCDFDGCNFHTFEESVLLNHKNRHSNSEQWICEYESCGKKMLTKRLLYNHIQAVHHNIRKYKCNVDGCDYTTAKSEYLTCHRNVVHKGVKPFKCSQCMSAFGIEGLLKRHIRLVHPLDPKAFKCQYSECKKAYKSKFALELHINRIHLKIEPKELFHCDECQYKSPAKSALLNHKNTVHRIERLFDCDFNGCNKSFKTQTILIQHQKRTHSVAKKYKCDECKVSYKYKQSLREHNIRVHTNSTFIECDWPGCQYKTKFAAHLKAHQVVHKTEEDISCDWPDCHKRFKSKAYLEQHLRIHTNKKRYVCGWPGCDYRSTQSGNLKKHLKVHKK